MSVARIATRYAKSLFDLAQERGELEAVKKDMDFFAQVSKHSEFRALLKSPIVKPDKKGKVFDAVFGGKIEAITEGFIKIVLAKGREEYLDEIAGAFVLQYRKFKQITTVKIVSAVPFSQEALNKIGERLVSNGIVKGSTEMESDVDPDVIGGFIMYLDDKIYDASVDYKLDQLRRTFTKNAYSREF